MFLRLHYINTLMIQKTTYERWFILAAAVISILYATAQFGWEGFSITVLIIGLAALSYIAILKHHDYFEKFTKIPLAKMSLHANLFSLVTSIIPVINIIVWFIGLVLLTKSIYKTRVAKESQKLNLISCGVLFCSILLGLYLSTLIFT